MENTNNNNGSHKRYTLSGIPSKEIKLTQNSLFCFFLLIFSSILHFKDACFYLNDKVEHKVTLSSVGSWRWGIMPFPARNKNVKISLNWVLRMGREKKQVASVFSIIWKQSGRDRTQTVPCPSSAQLAYFIKPNRWLSLLNDPQQISILIFHK